MVKVGIVIVSIAILAAVAGPLLTSYDPAHQELARRLEPPGLAHPLGLDELGRDILARLLQGARISLMVGIAVVTVSSTVDTVSFGFRLTACPTVRITSCCTIVEKPVSLNETRGPAPSPP